MTQKIYVVHDRVRNRVFTYVWTSSDGRLNAIGMGELFLRPKQRKILIDLSGLGDMRPTGFGTCAYDQNTHTMIGLMTNSTTFGRQMPTHLLLMDTISLTYKLIALPTFREKWDDAWWITSVKFISQ